MGMAKTDEETKNEATADEVEGRGAAVPPSVPPGEEVVAEPYVDPYKQVLSPYELPANPVAAAQYPGDNVDPAAPISDERVAQATAAIEAEQERLTAVAPEHPATAGAPTPQAALMSSGQPDEEGSYEANTVAELKDELATRGLPTSGNKDELVARLNEDDAARNAGDQQPIQVEGTVEGTVSGTVQEKR